MWLSILIRLHYNNLMSCNMDASLQQEELNQAAYSLMFLLCKASHKFAETSLWNCCSKVLSLARRNASLLLCNQWSSLKQYEKKVLLVIGSGRLPYDDDPCKPCKTLKKKLSMLMCVCQHMFETRMKLCHTSEAHRCQLVDFTEPLKRWVM
jgi:hypothetical protein